MLLAVALILAAPAIGQEEEDVVDTTTTTAPIDEEGAVVPAVPIEPPPETPVPLDWTYRFMIPTAVALAVIVVLMTSIRYFTNVVRKRYRIIEE